MQKRIYILACSWLISLSAVFAQSSVKTKEISVGTGWAGNSVNTVIFRKNALCSFGDTQYIAYYDKDGFVVLGKRSLATARWELSATRLKGNIADAHNSISIMTDGEGYLHLSWDQHNSRLRYCRSVKPGSLEMSAELSMTGANEAKVTYPEFYSLPGGDLLFLYRDGQSGQGNLVINRYHTKEKKWVPLHTNLVDGERKRNAYWQACMDQKGIIHLSWVWRESPDVASNHDMCYARSTDGGITWEKSNGEKYQLPVNATTAEYVCRIPPKSELINQTSISADEEGQPLIATYWRKAGDSVPQYHIIYKRNDQWRVENLGFRKTAFSLSGGGTKRIPVSRPQALAWKKKGKKYIAVLFRDEERGSKVSIAIKQTGKPGKWKITDLTTVSVGSWEPALDTELWKHKKQAHLFVQYTEQQDAEGRSAIGPTTIKVLELTNLK